MVVRVIVTHQNPQRQLSRRPVEDGDQGIPGEVIWSQKWGQRNSSTAAGRWRRWLKTEGDGEKWYVACAALGATRHKSVSKSVLRV